MKTSDKIEVTRLLIEAVDNSQVVHHGLVVIDAQMFARRLKVELSLLEKKLETEFEEALNEAASFGVI